MDKDTALLKSVEIAAIASYKYIGKKDKNAVDEAAVESLETVLKETKGARFKVINGEGELDKAPMLYVGQMLGEIDNSQTIIYDMSVDPVEGTYPSAYNFAGSIATIAISKEKSMMQFPEMYMEKFFVSQEFADIVSLEKSVVEVVKDMQKKAARKDLKCVILDKPRHQSIIKQLSELDVVVRLIQDGDVLGAIDVANGELDFIYSIGGAPEGSLMASLAISTGCKMKCKLISYDTIWPNEQETQERTLLEHQWLKKNNFNIHEIYDDLDLVNDLETSFYASGITAGGSLKPINYSNGYFIVNTFTSSQGIKRNIVSTYNVEMLSHIDKKIKFILDKYKR